MHTVHVSWYLQYCNTRVHGYIKRSYSYRNKKLLFFRLQHDPLCVLVWHTLLLRVLMHDTGTSTSTRVLSLMLKEPCSVTPIDRNEKKKKSKYNHLTIITWPNGANSIIKKAQVEATKCKHSDNKMAAHRKTQQANATPLLQLPKQRVRQCKPNACWTHSNDGIGHDKHCRNTNSNNLS